MPISFPNESHNRKLTAPVSDGTGTGPCTATLQGSHQGHIGFISCFQIQTVFGENCLFAWGERENGPQTALLPQVILGRAGPWAVRDFYLPLGLFQHFSSQLVDCSGPKDAQTHVIKWLFLLTFLFLGNIAETFTTAA